MRTIGAKNKPKTFNVSLGQLKQILNFENDATVLEVSIKYLDLLNLEETEIIKVESVVKTTESKDKVDISKPLDLTDY